MTELWISNFYLKGKNYREISGELKKKKTKRERPSASRLVHKRTMTGDSNWDSVNKLLQRPAHQHPVSNVKTNYCETNWKGKNTQIHMNTQTHTPKAD